MSSNEFIPGEKYISLSGSQYVYVYIGPSIRGDGVFQTPTGELFEFGFNNWKPYRLPVVHKRWLYWYRYNGRVATTTDASNDWKPGHGEILSMTEITYEEK